jgi:hypothetical protein
MEETRQFQISEITPILLTIILNSSLIYISRVFIDGVILKISASSAYTYAGVVIEVIYFGDIRFYYSYFDIKLSCFC